MRTHTVYFSDPGSSLTEVRNVHMLFVRAAVFKS